VTSASCLARVHLSVNAKPTAAAEWCRAKYEAAVPLYNKSHQAGGQRREPLVWKARREAPGGLVLCSTPPSLKARSTANAEWYPAAHEATVLSDGTLRVVVKEGFGRRREGLEEGVCCLALGPVPPSTKSPLGGNGRLAPGQARGYGAPVRRGSPNWRSKQGTADLKGLVVQVDHGFVLGPVAPSIEARSTATALWYRAKHEAIQVAVKDLFGRPLEWLLASRLAVTTQSGRLSDDETGVLPFADIRDYFER
jgi:hypothetical protein